jgi:hypothetical protein
MVDQRLRRAATCALFTSAIFLTGAAPAPPAGGPPGPTLEGDAFFRPQGGDDFAPAKTGDPVTPSLSVRTAPGVSSRVAIAPGVSLRLAPSTTFTLHASTLLPSLRPGANPVHAVQAQLLEGELELEAHDPASSIGLLVMLPNGRSVALWHGAANVSLHGDDVAVALYDGVGIVGVADQWKPIPVHSGIVLAPKSMSPTRPLPAPPRWIDANGATPPFAIVRGDDRAAVGATWAPIPDAASYVIETGTDATMSGSLAITQSDVPSMKTDPSGPGSYFVRVRPVAADGVAGPTSTVKALRIVRLSLPPLAFAAPGGAVVISSAQTVTLDDPRGIEVATASEYNPNMAPRWVPASSELGLGGVPKRTLLIRHTQSHVQSKLLLVRRELHARVSFNPPHPRWPGPPVEVVVKVEDPSGYLDPSRETVAIDLHVDLDKPNLSWHHDGDTWRAQVTPYPAPGPWVVRVAVEDRAGVAIGASLVDVDGPPVQNAKYHEAETPFIEQQ